MKKVAEEENPVGSGVAQDRTAKENELGLFGDCGADGKDVAGEL